MDIKALYEVKRQNFLIGYVQNPDRFDPALAFAYEHRIAPVYHEAIMREAHGEDPFAEAYVVSAKFMNEVLEFVDKCWLKKAFEEIEFYKLEDKFGGYKANRMELIHTIEYARISRRFDEEVFNAIEHNAPSEAKPIAATFSPEDVFFE